MEWYYWLGLAALAALIATFVVSGFMRAGLGEPDDDDGSGRTG